VRIIAALALALTLAGCSDVWSHRPDCLVGIADGADCAPGTAGYNHSPQAIAASDDAQCQSYGAVPGSQEYIQCRMNLDNQRAQMRQMIAGQIVGNMLSHQ